MPIYKEVQFSYYGMGFLRGVFDEDINSSITELTAVEWSTTFQCRIDMATFHAGREDRIVSRQQLRFTTCNKMSGS